VRRALTGCLFLASLAAAACSGEATTLAPRVDGGAEAGAAGVDAGESSDATPDVRETGAADVGGDAACVPLATGDECTATTGCSSVAVCKTDSSGFVCPCKQCELVLGATECAWRLQGDELVWRSGSGVDLVMVVAPDGGHVELPEVGTAAACTESQGYYVEGTELRDYTYTELTFKLCPASCSEHQADASMQYELWRHGCPTQ
jgi:hypothetical protein